MRSCWANRLGNCGGGNSKEHIISRGIFSGPAVRVYGLPWCKGEKEIGIDSLTGKMLCITHNNALSHIDDEGIRAFKIFQEMSRLTEVRKKMRPRPWHIAKYRLDGSKVERWFLKTLINLCYPGQNHVSGLSFGHGDLFEQLVRIAFGLDSFSGRAGLCSAVSIGQQIDSTDRVEFVPLLDLTKCVAGGLFSFRGFRFLLFLGSEGPPGGRLKGIKLGEEDWSDYQLNYHNRQISEYMGKYLSQVLDVKW